MQNFYGNETADWLSYLPRWAMPKKRILIVDNDEDFQMLYSFYFEQLEFDISQAFSGQEALDMLAAGRQADLIILDRSMPAMDGEEFLTRLRTEKKMNTPVVIASVDSRVAPEILELGRVHASLKKPFNVDSLLKAVSEALDE